MTDSRASILADLLQLNRPLTGVLKDLSAFCWDSDDELITLEPEHIASVLHRFLSGELSAEDVEDWANAIECREDIGLDPDSPASNALHELANPLLTRPLTRQSAIELVAPCSAAAT